MRALIRNINLPDAPAPTRAAYRKPVICYDPRHLTVVELPPCLPKRYNFPKRDPERSKRIQKSSAETMAKKRKIPRGWTEDMVNLLKRLYNDGDQLKDIAVELGVKYSTMTRFILRLIDYGELKPRPEPNTWTTEEIMLLKRLRDEQGLTYERIGEIMGRNPNGVGNKYRKEFGT